MVIHGAASMTVVWTMLLLWPGRCDASMVCPICLSMLVSLILYACFCDTSMGHYHYGIGGISLPVPSSLSLSVTVVCLFHAYVHKSFRQKLTQLRLALAKRLTEFVKSFLGFISRVLSILLVVVCMVPCCGNSFCYISNLMVVMLTCYESLLHTDIGCLTDAYWLNRVFYTLDHATERSLHGN
jgi:hypothetical protein